MRALMTAACVALSVASWASSGGLGHAASCTDTIVTSSGTAMSQGTAERNALVSLMARLESLYPGESRSRMSGAVEYDCKNPLLWRCLAKVTVCK